MQLTVLGCSGSVGGPGTACAGYLLEAEGQSPIVMDFGPGVLGELQSRVDPNDCDVILSHLHADHCLDLPALLVWRRYHPVPAVRRAFLFGPSKTTSRLGLASADATSTYDDISDTFSVASWIDREPIVLGSIVVEPYRVYHPPESYGLRITTADGAVLAYSGDTGACDALVELARGADVFLCEASWTHSPGNRPLGVHISGTEAGETAQAAGAKRLLLTHIPPWTSRDEVLAEAKAAFAGPVDLVNVGDSFTV